MLLHVFVKPVEHLGQHMQHGFAGAIAVTLMGEHDQTGGGTVALDGMVKTPGLDGESAGVVVRFAVNQEDGFIDLVRVHKGRQFEVNLRDLPEGSAFALEAKGREAAVVGPAAGNARGKQIAVY